ncbi:MAG: preprotein translocase subunit SecG [Clostridia bacterium]|nr:preprotein translocase subunit SecG [Clostridia bacterium]
MTIAISILVIISALFMIVTVLLQSSNARGLGAIAGEVTANMNKKQAASVDAKLALGTKIAAGVFVVLSLLLWMIG